MNSNYLDRISIAVWAVTLTLAASTRLRLPGQGAVLVAGDTSLVLPVAASSLIPLLLALLAGTGTHAVVRSHPLAQRGMVRFTMRFWALPVAVTLIAAFSLPRAPSVLYWAAGLLVFAVVLAGVLVALYFSLDPAATGYRRARAVLNLICYAIAFLLFLLIPASWGALGRSATTGAVTLLLALELLRGTRARLGWVSLYALVVGAIVAQVAWVLPMTGLSTLSTSLLLLLLFYLLVGMAWQTLLGRLTRRVVLEFGAVALTGLVLILAFAP